jgi:glutamyl-tRNA synthetase
MTKPVVVRFAPSPWPHPPGQRTNCITTCARQTGVLFILRIEDTDQKRYVPEQAVNRQPALAGHPWDGQDRGRLKQPYITRHSV